LQEQRGISEGKVRRYAAILALPVSSRALHVNCAAAYPSSFAVRYSDSRRYGRLFIGSGNNAILRDIADNRTLVSCPSASIIQ
jgi:hypothetical protein